MTEAAWLELGRQMSDRMRTNQLTYFIASSALTATIVFSTASDFALMLTVTAIGIGLFGILSFDAAQQGWIKMSESMPESVANSPVGASIAPVGQYNFYRATNALFTALIAVVQIIAIN